MPDDKVFFTGIAQMILDMQRGVARQQQAAEAGPAPDLTALRTWQVDRLKRTYADFLADERYSPACHFFLSDIYGPEDYSQRDQDAEHIYRLASRYIPADMLRLFTDVIWLNKFTAALDLVLLEALVDKLGVPLTGQGAAALTPELYAEGYRICDNYEARKLQIDLLMRVIFDVGKGTQHPLVGVTLRMAYFPAQVAGWGELHSFAVRGAKAFQKMKKPNDFAHAIGQREMHILDRIFENHTDPFGE